MSPFNVPYAKLIFERHNKKCFNLYDDFIDATITLEGCIDDERQYGQGFTRVIGGILAVFTL